MGFRMSIYLAGKKEETVGNDHKFYGYVPFDCCKDSFSYLYNICKKDSPFNETQSAEAVYAIFGDDERGPFKLSSAQFNHFIGLYLAELSNNSSFNESDVKQYTECFDKLCEVPGNKFLEWG